MMLLLQDATVLCVYYSRKVIDLPIFDTEFHVAFPLDVKTAQTPAT
jgi:hypothetical protein